MTADKLARLLLRHGLTNARVSITCKQGEIFKTCLCKFTTAILAIVKRPAKLTPPQMKFSICIAKVNINKPCVARGLFVVLHHDFDEYKVVTYCHEFSVEDCSRMSCLTYKQEGCNPACTCLASTRNETCIFFTMECQQDQKNLEGYDCR